MTLTLKQKRFINSYIRTGNGRLAAKEAGYNGNDHTLEQIASENLRKVEVTAALAAAFKPEEDLQERVVSEIKMLAFAPSDEPLGQSHKLKALEILAKFTQMFDDAPKVNVNLRNAFKDLREMSAEELQAELERLEQRKKAQEVTQDVAVSASSESQPPQEQEASLHTPPSSAASVPPPAPHATEPETLPFGLERIAPQ
ncbi:MAG: terminase small subunit [Candidatus Peribacteraceae bacterium]|nr:terminase small subunit [Candidatus Peribacteraceae bacterium]